MKTVIHRAESRGLTANGWLKSFHTFSFADYFDRDRINFGAIRVINDDTVQGGAGDSRQTGKCDIDILKIRAR